MKTTAEQLTPGREMINHLYELYYLDEDGKPKPYTYGDEIHIFFSLHACAETEEMIRARDFAAGLKKIISENEAQIECRASKVIVTPLI